MGGALGCVGSTRELSGIGKRVGVTLAATETVGWARGDGWGVAEGLAVIGRVTIGVDAAGLGVLVGRNNGVGRA